MKSPEDLESNVRSYCRSFPKTFNKGKGSRVWASDGFEYLDLFSGAGALNYGHNPEKLKEALVAYVLDDGITHSLDFSTVAKTEFMHKFDDKILLPRQLSYRQMFTGPTGTNAIEAALKLARKVTGRRNIAAFTNAFHGMSLGALAATGSSFKRSGAGTPLGQIDRYPFDDYHGEGLDTLAMIERLLQDPSSGFDPPAAFLVETVQAEGGVNTASSTWLRGLSRLAAKYDSLLIVDDIQAGCGRTGAFFSFEQSGIIPDVICLSKSLSGYGLPFSMVLLKPALDIWKPGEHNGTFRGNNLAFVTGASAIDYWSEGSFLKGMAESATFLDEWLIAAAERFRLPRSAIRGRGMIRGLALPDGRTAAKVSAEAFRRLVIIETSGAFDEVLKFLPALNIGINDLSAALEEVEQSLRQVLGVPSVIVPSSQAVAP